MSHFYDKNSRSEQLQNLHGDPNRQISIVDKWTIKDVGKAVLGVDGTALVFTDKIFKNSIVLLTPAAIQLMGKLHYNNLVEGVSFRIHSDSNADQGKTVDWVLIGYHDLV